MPKARSSKTSLSSGTQLYLPAGWARQLESRLDPVERLAELEKDRVQAKGDIREILDRLAEKAWRDGARRHGCHALD